MTKKRTELTRVAKIAQLVTLESVHCREVAAKRSMEVADLPSELSCGGSHEATGMRDLAAGQIVVIARFAFTASRVSGDDASGVAEVTATLSLRYSVPSEALKGIEPEEAQAFAETNGVYNAWPYWRELLQNTAGRLGIPGIVAPVFRLSAASQQEGGEENQQVLSSKGEKAND